MATIDNYLPELSLPQIKKMMLGYETIQEFQSKLVCEFINRIIQRSVANFSYSGISNLDKQESYLLLSNHRDIVLDSALINYCLNNKQYNTSEIAIGDNLLSEDWIKKLVRVNKSFIVKRNLPKEEMLPSSQNLSAYINHTIKKKKQSVWIAQREGRAKDGFDKTNPGLLKMFGMAADGNLLDHLISLNIAPVSLAYELDPCDASKAAELAGGQDYQKADNEDVLSIGRGIAGEKGNVHLIFGLPIRGDELTIDSVVAALDEHMRTHYRLFENALWAWQRLNGTNQVPDVTVHHGTITRQQFDARIDDMPEGHRELALAMYANPLRRALGEI